jgi:hypothetical protein
MTYAAHIAADEKTICNRLIAAALAHPRNLLIRVYDGEEWATDWTDNAAAIKQAIAATSETRLYFSARAENGGARRIGSILLIHGNGEDLISDSSHNPNDEQAESIIDALCNAANA